MMSWSGYSSIIFYSNILFIMVSQKSGKGPYYYIKYIVKFRFYIIKKGINIYNYIILFIDFLIVT